MKETKLDVDRTGYTRATHGGSKMEEVGKETEDQTTSMDMNKEQ
jgi:hypothetical protein